MISENNNQTYVIRILSSVYIHVTGRPSGATKTPTISLLSHHQLGFSTDYYPAFGHHNEVLIEHDNHLYLYKHISRDYSLMWKKRIPSGKENSFMAISGSENILLGTHCYNQNLQLLETFLNHDDLMDCTEDNNVVFCQCRQEGGFMLSIWKLGSQQPVMTLQPPAGRKWDSGLSVCYVANRIVVVDVGKETMDIFTQAGNMH